MKKKVVGYIRVSTDRQAEQGVSLDAQRAKIRAYAELNDAELLEEHIFEDPGISGSTIQNRPGVQKAIETACELKAVLFVYSLSRLSRSTTESILLADKLGKAGADLVSHTEQLDTTSAAGRMVFRVFAALNEFQREQTAERTRDTLRHKISIGEAVGSVPYGFRKVTADGQPATGRRNPELEPRPRRLVVDPGEAAVLLRIDRRLAMGHSYGRIARDLQADGVPSRSEGGWDRGYIRKLAAYYRQDRTASLRAMLRKEMGYLVFEAPAQASAAVESSDAEAQAAADATHP